MNAASWHSVSAKSIALVVTLIGISVAACAGLMIGHFKAFHRQLEMDRLQQNLAAAKLILNPYNDEYTVSGDVLRLGGHILNYDTFTVDTLSKTFGGVATIFQGDTRVTTNILKADGTRAVGTRLEPGPIYDTVLKRGKPYVGVSVILNKRYLTAYDPIKDTGGKVLGILFIGVEEGVADASITHAIAIAIVIGLILALVGAGVGWFAFHRMLRPFGPLGRLMEAAAHGEYTEDVPFIGKKDEFGNLARVIRLFAQAMKRQDAMRLAGEEAKRQAEAARLKAEAEARSKSEALVVGTFGEGLKALAEENWSYRLEARLPAAYRALQENFNTAIATCERNRIEREEAARRRDAERGAGVAARKRAEDEVRKQAVDLVVSSFGEGLSALARRDLSYRIERKLPAEYLVVRDDFNHAAAQLEAAMADINLRIGDIAHNTGEMHRAAQDMAERSERQAAALEESAAAISQISAAVAKSAENARHADDTALKARRSAERGTAVAKKTAAAMREIAASSNEIAAILGSMDEIAFQTNLLALNAGVEAARAGEAGRGFAVVASEIRHLAGRSADAARRIKTLIAANAEKIDAGVGLVAENDAGLRQIVLNIDTICQLMGEIALSQQEQSASLGEIDAAVGQMDRSTQANAAMAQQNRNVSEALAGFARALSAVVASFRTSQSTVRLPPGTFAA
jgi:methyl-accepting chemotaxis protein